MPYSESAMSAELAAMAAEMNCTEAEAAREALCQYYEAAGFTGRHLAAAIASLSDEAAIAGFCSL